MTDMQRDTHSTAQIMERLLHAARSDRPPEGAELRALSALTNAPTPLAPTPLSRSWRLAQLKWLGAAGLIGLIAVSSLKRTEQPVSAPAPHTAARAVVNEPAVVPSVTSLAHVQPLAQPSAPSASPTKGDPKIRRTAPSARGLHEELLSLEAARRPMLVGDAQQTLRLLEAHERAFPAGSLAPEAALLRVQALGKSGQTERAARLARQLLRDNPRTQYAHELAQWLQSSGR